MLIEDEDWDDNFCPDSSDHVHAPDWKTVTVESDGDSYYIDVSCKNCGRSGCVGEAKKLIEGISW